MNRVIKHILSPLRMKPAQFLPAGSAAPILPHELVDEEICPGYNSRHFYPANPGAVLANHYQLLVKIGWGTCSTVWLARDITRSVQCICWRQLILQLLKDGLDDPGTGGNLSERWH